MMKNTRTHVVAIARKPSTTITAIAQCGKLELLAPDCTLPAELELEGRGAPVLVERRDSDEPVVVMGDVAVACAAVDAIEAMTESANVVSDNLTSARGPAPKDEKTLTDCRKSRLWLLTAFSQRLVAPRHDPEKGIGDIDTIPIGPSVAPPRIIDLGCDRACLSLGVYYVLKKEYLLLRVAMEEVYVDSLRLREIRKIGVPWR
jgi:hypothetical protein